MEARQLGPSPGPHRHSGGAGERAEDENGDCGYIGHDHKAVLQGEAGAPQEVCDVD